MRENLIFYGSSAKVSGYFSNYEHNSECSQTMWKYDDVVMQILGTRISVESMPVGLVTINKMIYIGCRAISLVKNHNQLRSDIVNASLGSCDDLCTQ